MALYRANEAYWKAVDEILTLGGVGSPTEAMKNTMTGATLEGMEDKAAEWEAKGYRYASGVTFIKWAKDPKVTKDGGRITGTLSVCINATRVKAVDSKGAPVPGEGKMRRLIQIFQWEDMRWRAAGVSKGSEVEGPC